MKVIITGSTGMVGKGVLIQCLEDNRIKKILLVNRTSIKLNNPKIKEIICDNFLNLADYEKDFIGYDACFHCMGISVVGSSDKYYKTTTYDITKIITDLVFKGNKNAVFNYVTGEGTDSSEKGPIRWARIKGKAENYILQKGFKDSYMFRAGIIIPEKGIKSRTKIYNLFYVLMRPVYPILKLLPFITTTSKLGNAMINTLFFNYKKKIINNIHINKISFLS
jgi:nucleoside-diphosphate-sugar epimerase